MKDERIIYLHHQFITRKASREEVEEFDEYLNKLHSETHLTSLLEEEYANQKESLNEINPVSNERIFRRITAQPQEAVAEPKENSLWRRIAVAAAVTSIMIGAGMFYFNGKQEIARNQIIVKNDVNPGKQGATLTLANGKKIRLSDAANGELANEAGVTITKSLDGRLIYEIKGSAPDPENTNTLSTADGETYQVRLPDGSLVYLNAASSITYPTSLKETGKRVVQLRGEAFFEIAKVYSMGKQNQQTERVPFIVVTGSQQVEVLGTHFNVMAYADEPGVATTLIEGSVMITPLLQKKTISSAVKGTILKPGEQALNNGNDIKVTRANLENVTDWKEGDFFLNHVNFKTAMRKIARWYKVEMIYDPSVPDDIESGGWISRNRKLSEVLKHIESSGQVHFKLEGRKVYVSR